MFYDNVLESQQHSQYIVFIQTNRTTMSTNEQLNIRDSKKFKALEAKRDILQRRSERLFEKWSGFDKDWKSRLRKVWHCIIPLVIYTSVVWFSGVSPAFGILAGSLAVYTQFYVDILRTGIMNYRVGRIELKMERMMYGE